VAPRPGLASVFLARLPAASPVALRATLDGVLSALVDAGRAGWPAVALDAAVFVPWLAERFGEALPPLVRAADVYIASACALGVPSALAAFGRHYRGTVAHAIARIDPSDAFLDDVMQALRVKLFVRTGDGPAGIAQYSGRSSLRGWLATTAARTALNLRRRKGDRARDELRSGIPELNVGVDPELLLLKAQYKAEFEAAIRVALGAIPADQRTLLLLQIVDGVTLPQLATMRRVSRATVVRWLAAAREALLDETRRDLMQRLRLTASEYDSLAALVRSQLEVSLLEVARS
jgi:RNA polymerase sigma-70 factor (ECF subfamily)